MSIPTHLAVLDDEADITQLLAAYFANHGFRVSQLHTGPALMDLMVRDAPALVLLDLGLPGEDGFDIAQQLRDQSNCGLVIITGQRGDREKLRGFKAGADDYVTKPFDLRELLARIKSVLRRISTLESQASDSAIALPGADATSLRFAQWQLDLTAHRLLDAQGHEVALTDDEFNLLRNLALHAGRALSRDFLLGETHGREGGPFDRTIDVQIGRLRSKLEDNPDNPQIIQSVRGAGYMLASAVQAGA